MSDKTRTPAKAEKSSETKKPPKSKKKTGEKKMSALDAAAKVLAEHGEPMQC
jgi:hypothetical protein